MLSVEFFQYGRVASEYGGSRLFRPLDERAQVLPHDDPLGIGLLRAIAEQPAARSLPILTLRATPPTRLPVWLPAAVLLVHR